MMCRTYLTFVKPTSILLVAVIGFAPASPVAAQLASGLTQPIYRVAHEEPVAEPAQQEQQQQPTSETPQLAARIAPATSSPPKISLEKQDPNEHPLMPALRVAQNGLQWIDGNIHDYTAVLRKQERIDGELMDEEVAYIKVRHKPFAVYMYFLSPHKGRECLYNAAPDGGKGVLVARDCGWRRRIGKVELDPEGGLAMKGQKYPIMKLGIRELTSELIKVATNDVQFAECEVKHAQGKMQGRPVTWIQVVHPVPRANFRFHKAEVFIDNELQVPVRYRAYLWPEEPGGEPLLEESYTYVNLKVNNGFTDADFDKESPAIFR